MWYMVSGVEYYVVIIFADLQCVVCGSGMAISVSPHLHCMTDCVDVLLYRQWTMRS